MNSTSDSEPRPELQVELRVLAGWDALALDARLHAADLADVVLGHRPFVHELLGERAESPAECGVAGDEPGLGERLALPRAGPTARSTPRKPSIDRASGPWLPSGRSRASMRKVWPSAVVAPISWTSCAATCSASWKSAALSPSYTNSTSMSDAYDSSAAAEAAHADHRERERRAERRQRGLEARLRQHRELALGRFEPRVAEEVAGRDAQQLASLEAPEPFTTLLLVAAPLERVEGVGDELGARALDREGRRRRRGCRRTPGAAAGRRRRPGWTQEVARALGRARARRGRSPPGTPTAPVPRPVAAAGGARGRGRVSPRATRG